ncbi:dATP/dGTP pyrophosphohydrolase domain-containing protein [Klebsiella pneumoniae]|nr:dATP/dGTP pyrophosphohydrolase domain-containing protein [Klebsiella pneumoniae]
MPYGTKLYHHAQPASEREQVRSAHAEWSQATFGNVGPVGPLKHLSKEALEAAAEPGDLSEWADIQFLLWDAQRRAGITDEQITQAMIEKLAVNKQRSWPEPKDGEARLHIKEQPAPVVPEEITSASAPEVFEIAAEAERLGLRGTYASYAVGWNACRAAMLQELKKSAGAEATCRSNENVQVLHTIKAPPAMGSLSKTGEVLHTNSPAQSDCCPAQNQGWISVSERLPDEGDHVLVSDGVGMEVSWIRGREWKKLRHIYSEDVTHWMPLPAAPKEVKGE